MLSNVDRSVVTSTIVSDTLTPTEVKAVIQCIMLQHVHLNDGNAADADHFKPVLPVLCNDVS